MAERQGFEPWIPCGIHAFQACAFSHSAISPATMQLSDFTTTHASDSRARIAQAPAVYSMEAKSDNTYYV